MSCRPSVPSQCPCQEPLPVGRTLSNATAVNPCARCGHILLHQLLPISMSCLRAFAACNLICSPATNNVAATGIRCCHRQAECRWCIPPAALNMPASSCALQATMCQQRVSSQACHGCHAQSSASFSERSACSTPRWIMRIHHALPDGPVWIASAVWRMSVQQSSSDAEALPHCCHNSGGL